MKMKTSELSGAALDLAVAKACGVGAALDMEFGVPTGVVRLAGSANLWRPSTDWSQGGPLIERHPMQINATTVGFMAVPVSFDHLYERWEKAQDGQTLLIAACRAIVAAKLGDTVDIPEELL
jgi:hypothetical protein